MVTGDYGTEVTAPVPVRTGYRFDGWNAEVPQTMPEADCTYTAQWTRLSYSVSVVSPNGTVTLSPDSGSWYYDQAVTVSVTPDSGYSLSSLTYTPQTAALPMISRKTAAYMLSICPRRM